MIWLNSKNEDDKQRQLQACHSQAITYEPQQHAKQASASNHLSEKLTQVWRI
jgi:hypothetical protein